MTTTVKTSQGVAAAVSEAQNIVEAAKRRAAEIEAKAHEVVREARDRGYQEGFAKGVSDSASTAVRLIADSTAIGDKLSEQAAKLAIAIAPTVIEEHLRLSPDSVKKIARKALQESIVGDSVTIVVNPEDRKALESIHTELKRLASGAAVAIESDSSLSRGGCLIKTDFGEVDASVEALIDAIASKLGIPRHGR
jgi:type III secretion system HrpE/YscL family protein